jgi:predicted ATP-grasp superfamily ATP-dependent carboligase
MALARILVLDGHSSAALAFVRSLGRAGHWVAIASVAGSFAAAAKSRYCKVCLNYSNPMQGVDSFIDTIRGLILEYGIELVVPITDATVWPLSQAEELQKLVKIAAPEREAVELVSDKYRTVTLAASLGVPVPETMLVQSVDELVNIDSWGYPIVVKDRFSINWKNGKGVSGGVQFAYNIEELHSIVNSRLSVVNEVLLQSFSPGEGIGFSCFSSDRKIYLPFEWRRLREKDPRGSGSSARMSVRLDADVVKHSSALILEAGFQGIAMVEYKRNRKNGALTLMEINGRPWGSMQLPVHAGIDYPSLLVEWIINGHLPQKLLEYRENITCRWLTADFVHLENLWEGQPSGWPEPYPNFWVNVCKVLLPWYPGLRYDHLSFDDPGPGIADLKKWFNGHFRSKAK